MTDALAQLVRRDIVEVATGLIGSTIETRFDGIVTAVMILETEAYSTDDPASHSFRGPTPRTLTMFGPVGRLYVYRSYGIHWCINVVAGRTGSAVLLRGGRPLTGVETMQARRERLTHLVDGPGKLAQALGITGANDGADLLTTGPISLRVGPVLPSRATPRIGISRAVEVPWRFEADSAAPGLSSDP